MDTELQAIQNNFIHQFKLALLSGLRDRLFGETAADLEFVSDDLTFPTAEPTTQPSVRLDRAPGSKRSPEELEKLTRRVERYIGEHPGQRMESMSVALAIPTPKLAPLVKKLIANGTVRFKGATRARVYFLKAK